LANRPAGIFASSSTIFIGLLQPKALIKAHIFKPPAPEVGLPPPSGAIACQVLADS
jgi:hypothetical protein